MGKRQRDATRERGASGTVNPFGKLEGPQFWYVPTVIGVGAGLVAAIDRAEADPPPEPIRPAVGVQSYPELTDDIPPARAGTLYLETCYRGEVTDADPWRARPDTERHIVFTIAYFKSRWRFLCSLTPVAALDRLTTDNWRVMGGRLVAACERWLTEEEPPLAVAMLVGTRVADVVVSTDAFPFLSPIVSPLGRALAAYALRWGVTDLWSAGRVGAESWTLRASLAFARFIAADRRLGGSRGPGRSGTSSEGEPSGAVGGKHARERIRRLEAELQATRKALETAERKAAQAADDAKRAVAREREANIRTDKATRRLGPRFAARSTPSGGLRASRRPHAQRRP